MNTTYQEVIFAVSLIALGASSAFSQTNLPAITIGDTGIRLGAGAPRTIAALQEHFNVNGGRGESSIHQWFVAKTEDPNQLIGILYVKENVIVGVENLVSSRNLESAEDVFAALYEVSSKFSQKARVACTIAPWTNYNPIGLTIAGIYVDCGLYRVRLVREQYKATTGYSVWEDLGTTELSSRRDQRAP